MLAYDPPPKPKIFSENARNPKYIPTTLSPIDVSRRKKVVGFLIKNATTLNPLESGNISSPSAIK